MSRSLGPTLPDALLARLLGGDRADRYGEAIVLVTVDTYGRAHPALVSYAEVLALDPGRIRLGLHAGTHAAAQLAETARATLVFADAEICLYVKADAVPLPAASGHADLARFELHVRDVLADRAEGPEAGARLTGGITFEWPGGAAAWTRWAESLRSLLGA